MRPRPEVDPFNYAPRVRLPVLMLNGRYDLVCPAGVVSPSDVPAAGNSA